MTDTQQIRVGQRQVPWARIGTGVDGAMTAEEAIERAGLDWEVELAPVFHKIPDPNGKSGAFIEKQVKDRFVVRRKDTWDDFGTVGSHYHPFQNREAFEFCDYLVESGEAKYTFAGKAKNGRQVVLVMQFPDGLQVAGEDAHDLYALLRTSHDGTKAISIAVTPVRHACTNVMSLSLYSPGIKQRWAVQHTSTVQGKLEEARDTLKLTSRYAEEFKKAADQLAATDMAIAEFETVLKKILPDRPKTPEVIGRIQGLLQNSPNIRDEHRATAWGGMNAITEYFDWKRDTRSPEAKFLATMDGVNNQMRNRAATLLLRGR